MDNKIINVQDGEFRPTLAFYHANGKGTGGVVRFELHPAHGKCAGSLFAVFAAQRTVPSRATGQFASFDWEHSIPVKLDIGDLSQMLQVFRGMQESIGEDKGIYHESQRGHAVIRLEHRIEPRPGYRFSVTRTLRGEENATTIGVFLSVNEALGLALAIEQSLSLIAFGIPKVMQRKAPAPAANDFEDEACEA